MALLDANEERTRDKTIVDLQRRYPSCFIEGIKKNMYLVL